MGWARPGSVGPGPAPLALRRTGARGTDATGTARLSRGHRPQPHHPLPTAHAHPPARPTPSPLRPRPRRTRSPAARRAPAAPCRLHLREVRLRGCRAALEARVPTRPVPALAEAGRRRSRPLPALLPSNRLSLVTAETTLCGAGREGAGAGAGRGAREREETRGGRCPACRAPRRRMAAQRVQNNIDNLLPRLEEKSVKPPRYVGVTAPLATHGDWFWQVTGI